MKPTNKLMMKNFNNDDFNFWRLLINFWSILFFVIVVIDFFTNNACTEILNVLAVIYIGALAIYVSNKEFERWYDKHESKHPGEVFVVIWSVLVFCLFVLDFIFKAKYQMPNSVISSYLAVLTILAVTRKSKELYSAKHVKKKGKKRK